MTTEEKQLLLKDLCARLPYGVICYDEVQKETGIFKQFEYEGFGRIHNGRGLRLIENIKPYLRPMSSMTEEEHLELRAVYVNGSNGLFDEYSHIDWFNKNMFDYRGLIEKGLALEAEKGMYKTE